MRDIRIRWALEEAGLPWILLHLGERSGALLPSDPRSRSDAKEWLFAALNSVEMASLPWSILIFSGEAHDTSAWKAFDGFLKTSRLAHLEPVMAGREWLAGTFSIADILMADVLRLVDRFDGLATYPACRDYVTRATERPGVREGTRRPDGTLCGGGLNFGSVQSPATSQPICHEMM